MGSKFEGGMPPGGSGTEKGTSEDGKFQDSIDFIKRKLTGEGDASLREQMSDVEESRYKVLRELAEIQLITEGYEKRAEDGIWQKSEAPVEEVPAQEQRPQYTTLSDHEAIIRARLTGGEFPESAKGKMESPLWVPSEEAYTTENVKRRLTSQGYQEDEDGIWRRPQHLIN